MKLVLGRSAENFDFFLSKNRHIERVAAQNVRGIWWRNHLTRVYKLNALGPASSLRKFLNKKKIENFFRKLKINFVRIFPEWRSSVFIGDRKAMQRFKNINSSFITGISFCREFFYKKGRLGFYIWMVWILSLGLLWCAKNVCLQTCLIVGWDLKGLVAFWKRQSSKNTGKVNLPRGARTFSGVRNEGGNKHFFVFVSRYRQCVPYTQQACCIKIIYTY